MWHSSFYLYTNQDQRQRKIWQKGQFSREIHAEKGQVLLWEDARKCFSRKNVDDKGNVQPSCKNSPLN